MLSRINFQQQIVYFRLQGHRIPQWAMRSGLSMNFWWIFTYRNPRPSHGWNDGSHPHGLFHSCIGLSYMNLLWWSEGLYPILLLPGHSNVRSRLSRALLIIRSCLLHHRILLHHHFHILFDIPQLLDHPLATPASSDCTRGPQWRQAGENWGAARTVRGSDLCSRGSSLWSLGISLSGTSGRSFSRRKMPLG